MSAEQETSPAEVSAARVVAAVREALIAGELAPGERLVEADLCLRFGVGRSQVREALNRLASENVVLLSRNKGATIRRMSLAETIGAIEVMAVLIGLAARGAAAAVADHAATLLLDDALEALGRGRTDTLSLLAARRGVYRALIVLAGNAELERIVDSMQYHVLQGQMVSSRAHDALNAGLRSVVAAVLAGDAAGAETRARAHIRELLPA